jgi:hypothetical protein
MRALVRRLWRAARPPERVALIGEGPLIGAIRRKFDLFRDTHVPSSRTISRRSSLWISTAPLRG